MKTGWVTKRLGEVCEVILGGTPKTSVPEYWGGSIPWLTPGDMGKMVGPYVERTSRSLTPKGLENGSTIFPARSVIISTRAPIGYAFINRVPMSTNQGCKTLVPTADVWPEFLYYNIIGRTQELNGLGTGTTFKELATGVLKGVEISLPPLAEQKRIVAKIDAAFEKIDRLKANAERNLANAKELFQSALNEAMRPKPGWVEKRLGEIAEFKNGLNFKRKAGGCKVSIVGVSDFSRVSSIEDGTPLDSVEIEDVPGAEWYLHPDDFVFVRSNGSKKLVGRVLHIKTDRQMTFSGFCIRMRMADRSILQGFLFLQVSTEAFRERLLSGRNSSTINNVTQPILSAMAVAVPPIKEQKTILERCERLMKNVRTLQSNYTRLIADCAEMRQAVLKEAFEGRL